MYTLAASDERYLFNNRHHSICVVNIFATILELDY